MATTAPATIMATAPACVATTTHARATTVMHAGGVRMHELHQPNAAATEKSSRALLPGAFVETLEHGRHLIPGRGQATDLADHTLRWVSRCVVLN